MTTQQVQRWNGFLLAVYAAAFLTLALPCGIWTDRGGHRQMPLLVGALSAAGACLLFYLGHSTTAFALARTLQGGSSAAIWVVGLVVINDVVPLDRLGRAMAWVMAAYSLSGMLSPLIAGAMYQRKGINAALALVALMMALDAMGRLLWIASTRLSTRSTPRLTTLSGAARNGAVGAMKASLRCPRLWDASATNVGVITVFTAIDVTLAMHASTVLRVKPFVVACMVFLLQAPGFFLAPLMGWLVDRVGVGKAKCIGLTTVFPACVVISREFQSSVAGMVAMTVGLVMIGFGGNLVITALMAEFGHIAREVEGTDSTDGAITKGALASSYGIFTTTLAVAICIGSLAAQAVVNSLGWSVLYLGLALLTATLDLIVLCRSDVGGIACIRRRLSPNRTDPVTNTAVASRILAADRGLQGV